MSKPTDINPFAWGNYNYVPLLNKKPPNTTTDDVSIVKKGDDYNLVVGKKVKGTISVPKDKFLKDASYANNKLTLKVGNDSETKKYEVAMNAVTGTYAAGKNVTISDTNEINFNTSEIDSKIKDIEQELDNIEFATKQDVETIVNSLFD